MEERRGWMRAVAEEVGRIAAPALGKRGLAEGQLVTRWAEIIGPELAERTAPERLAFARRDRRDGTLHLRVASSVALEVQHREPQLIERINGFFGYRAVARLRLVQAPPGPRRAPPPPAPPLAPADEEALDRRLAAIEDPALKAALKRLGQRIVGRSRLQ
jgi:hypothetical protein